MARVSEPWVGNELQEVLMRLTPQQAAGVLRIVLAELEGRSLSSLLDCPGQICTSTTYYGYTSGKGKSKGWRQKPDFVMALNLARRDLRSWMLERGVKDALTILAGTAPDAARALRQQILGETDAVAALSEALKSDSPEVRQYAAQRLGETGLPSAVTPLKIALEKETDPGVTQIIIDALGQIASWRDGDRRAAAVGILDRADVKTAAKQAFAVNDDDIDTAIQRELERLAAGGENADAGASESDAGSPETEGLPAPAPVDAEPSEAAGAE